MKIQSNQSNINFRSGLTSKMKTEISGCDISKISNEFAKTGIATDFKNNKVIAWCSLKSLEIIQALNKKFNLNLALPKAIYVEDFNNLRISDKNSPGFCNTAPSKLYMGNIGNAVVPERVIFFNSFSEFQTGNENTIWNCLDSISDMSYSERNSATNFFLETFLHEFTHCIHLNNMLQKLGGENLVKNIQKAFSPSYLKKFHSQYDNMLKQICDYAAENPMEAVGCDFSKRLIESLDRNNLTPQNNFIHKSPYESRRGFSLFKQEAPLDAGLRKFWNGKF